MVKCSIYNYFVWFPCLLLKECWYKNLNALRIYLNFSCIYLGEGRGALKHVYVFEHIVSLYYRTAWWTFTKLGSELFLEMFWTWARVQTARSTAYFNGCPYIFYILLDYYICLCTTFLWPLRFGWLLVLSLYKEDYLQIFKCVSFWLHGCCG